jgi:tetratricopeptide (TPR) repeat protein
LHLHPTGKPESVLPSVGLYFTDKPPTNTPFLLKLARYNIDIAPGQKDYQIENSFVLPVDVDLMRINPHAHYLAKQMEGWAVLPDGTKKWLLKINDWDFNWQGDYLYEQPIPLPKGTTLFMRFGFDNSAENVRNPNQPPKRVQFGLQTTDEMGELWFQLLPRNSTELAVLSKSFFVKYANDTIEANQWRLQQDPQNAMAHAKLGSALFSLGNVDEALKHLQTAAQLDPTNPVPHSQLGSIYLNQKLLSKAQAEFEAVIRTGSQDYEAYGSLGYICIQQQRYGEAETYFEKALEINPEDKVAAGNLKALRNARRQQR